MTKIIIESCSDGSVHILLDGHSGDTLVCCAVSMLIQASAAAMTERFADKVRASMDSGRCEIRIDKAAAENTALLGMLAVLKNGVSMLEKTYPENVMFKNCFGFK